ncbi:MAG: hypothetical protein AAF322_20545 [Pseudomonadota bacterium]
MTDATIGGAPPRDDGAAKTADQTGPLLAADGTPLKRRLAQALFRTRLRAFGLAAPLLAFISLFFFLPILIFL